MSLLNIDVSGIAPNTGIGDPLPKGWYNVLIDQSELKPTSTGGQYLELRFNVVDGQFKDRKLFSRLNIRNANPQAQEIAYRDLSAIGHAIGVLQIADSSQLHNKPLKVRVRITKETDEYEAGNEITAYRNINEVVATGSAPATGGVPPAPTPAPPPVGGTTWAPPAGAPAMGQPAPAPAPATPATPAPVAQQVQPAPAAVPWAGVPTGEAAPVAPQAQQAQAAPVQPLPTPEIPAWAQQQPPAA